MNAKRAKALRAAAKYRNQTATPGTMPFPGIMPRGYRFPVVNRITKLVRVFSRIKGQPRKFIEVQRIENSGAFSRLGNFYSAEPVWKMAWYPKLDENGKPVGIVVEGQGAGEWGQAFEIMPVSKPGRLNAKQPKGIYRELKRLERKVGLANIIKGEHDWRQMSPEQQEVVA
jgi:hypothetical protein